MELSKNKKHGITLVELIIALTMASILMLTMFGVIFKKTKSSIISPSGSFYCWKDFKGILHQKIIYSVAGKTESQESVVESCKLDFPKYVSKDSKLKAYIIGGGAAGEYRYDVELQLICNGNVDRNGCSRLGSDTTIDNLLSDELSCFSESKNMCIEFNKLDTVSPYKVCEKHQEDNRDKDIYYTPPEKNYNGGGKLGDFCYVKLADGNTYKFSKDRLEYAYYNGDQVPSASNCQNEGTDTSCQNFPFLYSCSSRVFINGSSSLGTISSETDKFSYKAYNQILYKLNRPNASGHEFKAIGVDNVFDLTNTLEIAKDDIGNGGVYVGDNRDNDGFGGDTKLRSQLTPENIVATAPGVQYIQLSKTEPLNYNIENLNKFIVEGKNISYRFQCNGDKQNYTYPIQNTKVHDYTGLTEPKRPDVKYNCDSAGDTVDVDYDYNNDGFGLFGYNGAPNDYKVVFRPFEQLKFYGDKIDIGSKILKINNNFPGNGMGGAIIITWN